MKKNRELRRTGAKKRLEAQLELGKKTAKKGTQKVDLTEKDVKRINKDLAILAEPYRGYQKTNRKFA